MFHCPSLDFDYFQFWSIIVVLLLINTSNEKRMSSRVSHPLESLEVTCIQNRLHHDWGVQKHSQGSINLFLKLCTTLTGLRVPSEWLHHCREGFLPWTCQGVLSDRERERERKDPWRGNADRFSISEERRAQAGNERLDEDDSKRNNLTSSCQRASAYFCFLPTGSITMFDSILRLTSISLVLFFPFASINRRKNTCVLFWDTRVSPLCRIRTEGIERLASHQGWEEVRFRLRDDEKND